MIPPFEAPSDAQRLPVLQAGLDLLDQGLTVFDADLRMVAWNRAFLRLLDFPAHLAFVGAHFESFMRYNAARGEYGEDHEAQVARRVEAARRFAPHDIERVRPDGRVLRVVGQPLPGLGFVTLYSDVTAQRAHEREREDQHAQLARRVAERTQELQARNAELRAAVAGNQALARSLQRSEAHMRLILDSLPALIAYFDAGRRYRFISKGYQDWFGLDPQAPERVSARDYLGAATYEGIRPQVLRALAGEAVSFEYRLQASALGRQLLVRTTLIPERGPEGQVQGCFELTFDITEQRRAQEMLAQAQKMEALGHLSGGLAHDFNNLLTVIIGNLCALRDQRPGHPAVAEFVAPALEASHRGAELIKGLLSFSRRQPLALQAVALAPQVEGLARMLRRSLPESLRLDTVLENGPLWALSDPHQLQNSLLNLVLNARDAVAHHPRGGRIRIRCSRPAQPRSDRAPLRLPPGRYVRLDVADNGVGMDAETQARVFEPFFTTKRPGLGTGLGLPMVQDFVRQCGGLVEVVSAPGRGTTVSLWLPVAEPPSDAADLPEAATAPDAPDAPRSAATDTTAPPPAGTAPRGLALLVDDEAAVRQVVRRHLLELGHAVLEAQDGDEALAILGAMPGIGLLLTDVVMPGGLDGAELARRTLAAGQVPCVGLMSGYAPGALDTGGLPMLTKPFSREQLARFLDGLRTPPRPPSVPTPAL
ncbi:PAS-domain containing protein [Ideonella livida]|uniref:PAS-domain containing protein n=1 Tax=Ideonella livida TaxID=2707176 RepID=UPI0028733BB7|nr:PAS-domain containing protein [Ideonella livida]